MALADANFAKVQVSSSTPLSSSTSQTTSSSQLENPQHTPYSQQEQDQRDLQLSEQTSSTATATATAPATTTATTASYNNDKGGSIPTSNALSSSIESGLSSSAPPSSLSSVTQTSIISPNLYHPSTSVPASTSTLISFMDISSPSNRRSKDMHVKAEDSESTGSTPPQGRFSSSSPEHQSPDHQLFTDSTQQDPAHQSPGHSELQSTSSASAAKKENKVGVTATSCANCGTTTTPLWRRATNGQTICNACGLYFKARKLTRPPWLKRNVAHKKGESSEDTGDLSDEQSASTSVEPASGRGGGGASETGAAAKTNAVGSKEHVHDSNCAGTCPGDGNCNGEGGAESCAGCPSYNQHHTSRQNLICANCRTTTTPLWRRDTNGNTICNACGLYFKLHGVHRPVTMKRAVIKRRKRVHVATNSPPPADQQGSQQLPANQSPKSKQKSQKSKQPSHSPVPPTGSDLEPSDDDTQIGHTPTKRKRTQGLSRLRNVPAIEDYIIPKRTANGKDEWSRNGQNASDAHLEASPMDHTSSSGHQLDDHSSGIARREEHRYDSTRHTSQSQRTPYHQHPSRPQSQHGPPDYTSQPPRHQVNLHQSHSQYQPTLSMSMSMSRYSAYPPPPSRSLHSPPDHQSTLAPPHNQPSRSQHHHKVDDQHPHDITMQGYQGPHIPRPSDMDDDMHSPQLLSQSSGWNQRLPGYTTVSSSAVNARLSSRGVVHSSGPNSGSPPLYPRQTSASPANSYSHYPPTSPHGDYHRGESPQSSHGLSRSPSVQNGRTHYSDSRSSSPGGYSGSYHPPPPSHHHHHQHHRHHQQHLHHQLPSILNPSHDDSGDHGMRGTSESTHLPSISLPSPHQHQSLPSASEILHNPHHHSSHHHHHQQQHQYPPHNQRLSPSPTLPLSSSVASSALVNDSLANSEVLERTRQDLQREVTHLSMLLGKAEAVLSGLEAYQGLAPSMSSNGTSKSTTEPEPGSGPGLPTDPNTSSALASLMALSASGGDRRSVSASATSVTSLTGSVSPTPMASRASPAAAAAAAAASGGYSNGKSEDQQMYSPPPQPTLSTLPTSSSSSHRHSQALPYPLPRRD